MIRLGILALALAAGAQAELDFRTPPKVARTDEGTVVTFALSRGADVEVAVLEGQGRVVRPLAAGVLGGAPAPPPPLQPGLEQRIVWNGKDDLGAAAGDGPFKVRVRAGMKVEFGRMIGSSPYT